MPNPQLRVVPEVLAPCRAAKGVVGALIVIALVGIDRSHGEDTSGRPPGDCFDARGDLGQLAASATTRPAGAEYFPSGDTLNANETTPHIEAF